MFPIFQKHVTPRGLLLFTSGPHAGIAMGKIYGYDLFHASLDAEDYASILATHGFEVLLHRVEDPRPGSDLVMYITADARSAPSFSHGPRSFASIQRAPAFQSGGPIGRADGLRHDLCPHDAQPSQRPCRSWSRVSPRGGWTLLTWRWVSSSGAMRSTCSLRWI